MEKKEHYEIYLAVGSAVVEKETKQEALDYAKELSMQEYDYDVIVTKVTEVVVKKFRNGSEVA